MYISHKYKLIFLRTPKTASSSLSEFLIKNVDDPEAIYTPVDDTRIPATVDSRIIEKYKQYTQYVHLTLSQLIEEKIITKDMVENYRCFAVLRNPIDRQKSGYYFRKKFENKKQSFSIEDYKSMTVENRSFKGSPMSALKQSDLLKLDGKIQGEYWLYENLDYHIKELMKDLKLSIRHDMPRHKSGLRNKGSEIEFDKEIMNSLYNYFREDFELYDELKGKMV